MTASGRSLPFLKGNCVAVGELDGTSLGGFMFHSPATRLAAGIRGVPTISIRCKAHESHVFRGLQRLWYTGSMWGTGFRRGELFIRPAALYLEYPQRVMVLITGAPLPLTPQQHQ
jgi:hypothetical protein